MTEYMEFADSWRVSGRFFPKSAWSREQIETLCSMVEDTKKLKDMIEDLENELSRYSTDWEE